MNLHEVPVFQRSGADRYSFYRVPKALIKVDLFEKMSGDAKLLYAVLLDRMNLSLKEWLAGREWKCLHHLHDR